MWKPAFSFLLLLSVATPPVLAIDAMEAQRAAADKQRESTRRQTSAPAGAFFLTPWLIAENPSASSSASASVQVNADCDSIPEDQLRTLISNAAQKEGINPELIRAVVRRESGGRPCAVSNKGAQGLMQIMPSTQQYLGLTNPFDPAENIAAGTRYLKEMLTRYNGDLKLSVAAYNAGPQRVKPGGSVPDIPETKAYVQAILSDLGKSEEPPPQ